MLKSRPQLKSIDLDTEKRNYVAPAAETKADAAVEDQLMTLHHSSLRVRGVLHLLQETLQSRGGVDRGNADAICALLSAAERDLRDMDEAIGTLTEKHLESLRN